jgi:hypothetical protein
MNDVNFQNKTIKTLEDNLKEFLYNFITSTMTHDV